MRRRRVLCVAVTLPVATSKAANKVLVPLRGRRAYRARSQHRRDHFLAGAGFLDYAPAGTSDTHTALRGARRLWNDAAQRGGDCQGHEGRGLPLRNHVARLIPRACHGFGARPRWPHRSPSEHSALASGRAPRSRQVPRAYPSRTVREAGSGGWGALQFQSSSASRLTAGAAGFLTFTQQSARPER